MEIGRYLEPVIAADLATKMVFVAGPRQVGKTTLARHLMTGPRDLYLNWDNREHRVDLRAARWPSGEALVVLDELHKWRQWKGWLKGEFDAHHQRLRFLVTGSARMDVYRRGGDSLQGRYHHYRLHPLSMAELGGTAARAVAEPGGELAIPGAADDALLQMLLRFGGFPEPVLAQSDRTLRRWHKERLDRVVREDVRDLEAVRDLSGIEGLADFLPERVGSLLSLNALREDLQVSHDAVSTWMDILERLYFAFRLRPFVATRVRSLGKAAKAYLWDWSIVPSEGARFENLVAGHLLKYCHLLEDRDGWKAELWYLRDRAGHEVDFLVTIDARPWFAVEAKLSQTQIDKSLLYFHERLEVPAMYQVVRDGVRDFVERGVRCVPAARFLAALV